MEQVPVKEISIKELTLFEHRFWLQILGDHSRFIFNALSPKETEEIQKAQYFIGIFDQMLQKARMGLTDEELRPFTERAYQLAQEIRAFKLHLIKKHLIADIMIELPPTFLNHMVNEVEEYIRVLGCLIRGEAPIVHPLQHHMLWLPDAAGHAAAIAGSLDMVEKMLEEKSKEFVNNFENYFIKAFELLGYLRTNVQQFSALKRFNKQVEKEITEFTTFLRVLEKMVGCNEVLGTLYALLLDHMAREECYYLIKLSMGSDVKKPDCDPTKPRTQS